MKNKIYPSIIAKNQKELDLEFAKLGRFSSQFHLDIMQSDFVKNSSLEFDFKLPTRKKYQAHLMLREIEKWIRLHSHKVDSVFFHYEACKYPKRIINLIHKKKKKVGLVINPKTPISKIKKYLGLIDYLLVMTVHPGRYGAKFIPSALKKIKKAKQMNNKLIVQVDGGMNLSNVSKSVQAGADLFVSGSHIQKSKNIKKTINELNKKAI